MNKIKNRKQLQQLPGVYYWLEQNNTFLLDELLPLTNKKWTLESCKQVALKYGTRSEWKKNSGGAYNAAYINKWLDECCSHMEPPKNVKKYVRNLDTGEIFESMANAAKSVGAVSDNQIFYAIKRNGKCGGYHWAYCDEKGNIIK